MLDFVVTNHWWQKYESGEKNTEYRRKTPYWDKRVKNAITEHIGKEYARHYLDKLEQPLSEENNWLSCRFPLGFLLPANVRHGYTSETRRRQIFAIVIKNGKDTDLAIDDWVYCFCFEPERKRKQC
ncbi:MAG: hypothetical protein IJ558_04655 [Treponema sp.]|nr:hypothetical protein [Treponema sp.]